MAGTASDNVFWNDLLAEPTLRACGRPARSLWWDMLCVMAQPLKVKDKGKLLLNGRKPTSAELARMFGDTTEDVEMWLKELSKNGVYSVDRNGVIYNRRMVRDVKRRAASAKGGKIGGRVTLETGKGIFATQVVARNVTREGTQLPIPSHPIPKENGKKELAAILEDTGRGNGPRKLFEKPYSITDPDERINRFQVWLAKFLGADGWTIIQTACDPHAREYQRCLARCREVARANGKGWPREWPKDLEFFDRLAAKMQGK
jgi:hypothetical protein